MSKDYYSVLGVSKTATPDEIKSAFRKLAHQHHPDKGGNDAKFKEINEAYQVLGNAEKRRQYDQFGSSFQHGQAGGANGFSGFEGFSQGNINMDDLGDILSGFGDMFGFSSGRSGRSGSRQKERGHDLEMGISIDFLEAVFGTEKEIKLNKKVTCHHCHGQGAEPGSKVENCRTCQGQGYVFRVQRSMFGSMQVQSACPDCGGEGKIFSKKCHECSGVGVVKDEVRLKIKIPAGIDNGEAIRLSGQGEAGMKGAPAGDLYLRIKITPDKRFHREGADIRNRVEIGVTKAALGGDVEIETVHGSLTLKIPEGTQSGTVFRLKEKGLPRLHSHGQGDHFVEVTVKVPTHLSKQQKKMLEELAI